MCNFGVSEILVYYTHIPVLVLSILLGLFVLLSDRKNRANQNLFIFILFFCFWVTNDLLQWIIVNPKINLFLARIAIIEAGAIIFFLLFSYSFVGQEISVKKKISLSVPFLPILVFMFSDHNAFLVGGEQCNVQFGDLYWYMYLFLLVYLGWSIIVLIKGYREKKYDEKIRNQIKLVIKAFVFLTFWFIVMMVLTWLSVSRGASWGDELFLYTPIGMVIFISFLAYAITKYQFLNLKLIAAQALTYSIWILVGSQYFFAGSTISVLLITLTLLLSVIFGIMLIRSIKLEVQRKEELQLMSDKLSQANDQLRKLDMAKSDFISIASHQLRSPLTAVKGYISLIKEGSYGPVDVKVMDALGKVYISNERLIQLVEDLLSISRIESGRMDYKFVPYQIEDMLKDLADTYAIAAKNKRLYLNLKLSEKLLPKVELDEEKIRQVFNNLVDNALKYTERGGVTVRAELAARNPQPATRNEDFVRITISDTGAGITKENLPYIFAKFSRGKDTSKLHATGTGLGLYVGKQLVEAHHGRVWAESDGEGKGSRFIVELPLSQKKYQEEERVGEFVASI